MRQQAPLRASRLGAFQQTPAEDREITDRLLTIESLRPANDPHDRRRARNRPNPSAAAVAPGRPATPGDAATLHRHRFDSARGRLGLAFGERRGSGDDPLDCRACSLHAKGAAPTAWPVACSSVESRQSS
jgi:hypothetical protein